MARRPVTAAVRQAARRNIFRAQISRIRMRNQPRARRIPRRRQLRG